MLAYEGALCLPAELHFQNISKRSMVNWPFFIFLFKKINIQKLFFSGFIQMVFIPMLSILLISKKRTYFGITSIPSQWHICIGSCTSSSHVFTNSVTTNTRKKITKFYLFTFLRGRIFWLRSNYFKNANVTVYFSKKRHFAALKGKTISWKTL